MYNTVKEIREAFDEKKTDLERKNVILAVVKKFRYDDSELCKIFKLSRREFNRLMEV